MAINFRGIGKDIASAFKGTGILSDFEQAGMSSKEINQVMRRASKAFDPEEETAKEFVSGMQSLVQGNVSYRNGYGSLFNGTALEERIANLKVPRPSEAPTVSSQPLADRIEQYAGNKEGVFYSDAQIKSIERKTAKLRGEKRLGSEYTEEMGAVSAQQREIQAANQRKNAEDLRAGWSKEASSDVLEAEQDIATNIRGVNTASEGRQSIKYAEYTPKSEFGVTDAEVQTPKSSTIVSGSSKGNAAGEAVAGAINSAARANEKVEQLGQKFNAFRNKFSSKPNDFQKETTEMVSKFSGGKWTGGVNTEKMNWIQANANEHLYSSVGQDYNNLVAKMQGAKNADELGKLMEEHKIGYTPGMSAEDLNKNINAHFNQQIDKGPGIANYMLGNKAASGGMLMVSGASALALADSRGHRSNGDLYSSQI